MVTPRPFTIAAPRARKRITWFLFPTSCFRLRITRFILAHLSCEDASAWLHDVLKYILAGIAVNIAEVRCALKNKKLGIIGVKHDGSVQNNNVKQDFLIIKLLKGGEQYAMDLTGAQYGYFEPVGPLKKYVQSRVVSFDTQHQIECFGGTRDRLMLLTARPVKSSSALM
ncbi:hypothetical protein BKA65DRAFT_483346 [Rhexocercosporidium sp. MPI-PUGE-AT-0058]|nr:hypothetical protein BKA65DRAFT_483346 [Rhexocercosporidium sp. MPI-PUGE-AT-0058]